MANVDFNPTSTFALSKLEIAFTADSLSGPQYVSGGFTKKLFLDSKLDGPMLFPVIALSI